MGILSRSAVGALPRMGTLLLAALTLATTEEIRRCSTGSRPSGTRALCILGRYHRTRFVSLLPEVADALGVTVKTCQLMSGSFVYYRVCTANGKVLKKLPDLDSNQD
jgi:hypothetical protein